MHIVVYANSDSRTCERLNRAIDLVELEDPPEVHADVSLFCQRFRSMEAHPDIIIIMPSSHEELDILIRFQALFENTRTIVILPEREHATLSKGHKFHPSYITYNDDDFKEVTAILTHLKHNQCGCRAGNDVVH